MPETRELQLPSVKNSYKYCEVVKDPRTGNLSLYLIYTPSGCPDTRIKCILAGFIACINVELELPDLPDGCEFNVTYDADFVAFIQDEWQKGQDDWKKGINGQEQDEELASGNLSWNTGDAEISQMSGSLPGSDNETASLELSVQKSR